MAGGRKPTRCGLCPGCTSKGKRKCTNPLTDPLGGCAGSLLLVAAPDAVMPLASAEVENQQPESRTQAGAELPPPVVFQLQPVIETRPPLLEVQMVEAPLQTFAPPPVHPAVSFEVVPQTPQPQAQKRAATDTPTTAYHSRTARSVELPPLYGDHQDLETVSSTALLPKFGGWEACDMVELALFGGQCLLDNSGRWLHAVMPLVTQIECKIRGLPSPIDRDDFLLAARYATALREQVKYDLEIDLSESITDFELVEECRLNLEDD